MSLVSRVYEHRRSVASGGVVALFGAGLAGFALWYDGEATADIDLNDSGVWVTQTSTGTLGRFNHEAQALDGTLLANAVSFDVQQNAQRVLLENPGDATASPVDPAQLALRGTMKFPAGSEVTTGGSTTAVHDVEEGRVWVLPFDGTAAFDEEDVEPDLEAGAGGTTVVAQDGTVFVAVPSDSTLYTIETGAQGTAVEQSEDSLPVAADAEVQTTTVGDEVVVLDRSTGRLVLPGGDTVEVDGGAEAQLQQPSAASDVVVLASSRGLIYQPLDGGTATTRSANGTPARPVQLGGCTYGAWSISGQVIRDCPGVDLDEDMVLEGIDDTTALAYRVNRDVIVLNDMVNGTLWMAAEDFQKVDDWELTIPEDAEGEEAESEETIPEQVDQFVAERDKENRPPDASDDSFGVRPGRTTVLDVLGNDVDPDGDVMTASVESDPEGDLSVDRVMDGAALQIDVPDDAEGSMSFTYQVDDGRPGGTDTAAVKVRVVPPSENEAPVQSGEPVLQVGQDGSGTIKILPYFEDPDGDDLFLSHAGTTDPNDEVRFRPDGTVEFRDGGSATGRKIVDVTVSDSHGRPTEGRLLVDVVATNVPPIAVQDHVTVLAGQPVTVSPLTNDSDPNGDTLRLVHVAERDDVAITKNLAAGTFTVQGEEPGSSDITYQISDGPNSTIGLVRVDVIAPPDSDAAPVAVSDQVLLPTNGTALLDVLANDSDPAGGVLVVPSVDVPDDAPIDVSVLNHHVLKISETKRLDEPVTFGYTVANASGSTTGQVRVVPIPAPDVLRPPEAGRDEAVVHAGDVVTVPVLDNDSHPDGLEITLNDELQEEPDAALGEAFVSEDTVRFRAGSEAGTAHLVYEVVDSNGQKDSAQVTVTILDGEENAAPQVPDTEARVLSGRTVRIALPLDGVDPDGDAVALSSIASAPAHGRAVIADGFIDYTADKDAAGFDTFAYEVTDTRGAVGRGTVRVGVSAPPASNQAPQVVDDESVVRPGRTVAVRALENDSDPDGDEIGLVTDGFSGMPEGIEPEVVDDDVVLDAPQAEGTYAFYYTVQDAFKARSTGAITLTVDDEAPLLRPVAADDVVSADQVEGAGQVPVDVLANDVDPDGVAADLAVSVDEELEGVTVTEDGQVSVTLTAQARVITYTVTDVDGLEAQAFVRVPGDQARPYLEPGMEPLEATSGEPLTIDLAEHVVVREEREPRITEEKTVQATEGSATVEDHDTLVYTSAEDYAGAASVSFEVTDGDGPDDADGLTAVLTLPIDVVPAENLPPEVVGSPAFEVAAGEEGAVDLSRYVEDPDGDALTFEVDGGEGVSTSVTGGTVTAQVDPSVPKGTVRSLGFTVSDGENSPVSGSLSLTVVGSTRPLVQTAPDEVPDAHQGEQIRVPVLENDTNPFPEDPLTIVGAHGETGQGEVSFDDSEVVVTPGADFHGVLTVRYTVQDATEDPDRQVDGVLTVTVLGRPEAPRAPVVEEVRSETVVLSWEQPNDNGAEITGYTLRTNDGRSTECTTTTCTFDGLTNNVTYTFTVAAINDVGESEESPASDEARPDEKPDPPEPPTLEFGDESLTVTWENRTYTDRSPIECVNLEISPAPADGRIQQTCVTSTSVEWGGLTNGTAYTVRVQALNAAPDPSEWSEPSAEEIPAGPPFQPAAPTATRVDTAVGGQTTVTWDQPNTNGDAIKTYFLDVIENGSVARTIEVPGTSTSQTIQDLTTTSTYTFTVSAENKAGTSETSAASNAVIPYGTPEVPTGVSARLGDNTSQRAIVSWNPSADARGPGEYYQVRANGSGARSVGDVTEYTYTGLANGTSYTFQVRACNDFTCNAWSSSPSSNSVTPYGAVPAPTLSVSGGDQKITYSWSTSTNGRPITVKVTSGRDTLSTKRSGSGTIEVGHSKTREVCVTASDNEGQSSQNCKSATSDPPPEPRAWVTKGASTGVVKGCSSGSCNYFVVNTQDLPAGNYKVECWSGSNPAYSGGWHNIVTGSDGTVYKSPGGPGRTVYLGGSPQQLTCFYGHSGTQVGVVIDGKRYYQSDARTW